MKKVGFALLWVAVTTLLGVATWTAVGLAGEQVSDDAISPLSASQIATLPVSTSTTTIPSSTTTTTESPGPASSTTSTTSSTGLTTTTATSATTGPVTTTSSTTTTVTTTMAPTTSVHSAIGGTVAIEMAGETVTLLWTTPSAGFLYEVEDAGPERVEVEFKSSEHESHLRAEIVDGELRVEIEEESEGE